jgi:glutaredoxin-like protein NrdH
MHAVLLSQPNCAACTFAAKDLTKSGITFTVNDIRTDAEARDQLLALYAARRPVGERPQTPVTVIGHQVFFGPVELHQHLRDLAKAVAA